MAHVDNGLWARKQADNHNAVIAPQRRGTREPAPGEVRFALFGGSAFRITSPAGVTPFVDPWRNLPGGAEGQFFLHELPPVRAHIGLSTHAHFDHDALHLLNADMLLDRVAGTFSFADVRVHGIADKRVSDFSGCPLDLTTHLRDRGIDPPPAVAGGPRN